MLVTARQRDEALCASFADRANMFVFLDETETSNRDSISTAIDGEEHQQWLKSYWLEVNIF